MSKSWPSALPRPRALLFDWDNTLVGNWGTITQALNAAFAAFDMPPWTVAEAKRRVRSSMRESFPEMFGAEWQRARDVFYGTFQQTHLQTIAPMRGADAMLRGLKSHGLYLGVVSNKHGPYLRAEAAHLGWSRLFGGVVGAADCARDKPAIEPVELALKPGGIARGPGVWLVGDADIDMQCARKAGCTPVLLHPEPPGEGFGRHRPALWLGDCDALLALLAQPQSRVNIAARRASRRPTPTKEQNG